MNRKLNIKYIFSQIFYCSAMCSMLGFASIYLLSKNFSNSQIGIVFASSNMIAAIMQPIIASYVEKMSGGLNKVLGIIIGMTIIISSIIYFIPLDNLILMMAYIIIISMNLTLMPFINSLAFSFEKFGYKINFGLARGLGSVAYALSSVVLGNLVKYMSISIIPLSYLLFNIVLFAVIKSYKVNDDAENTIEENKAIENQLSIYEFVAKYKLFVIFLIGLTATYCIHVLINNFFIQIITDVGGSSSDMGYAIFIGAMVELPIMAFFEKINKRIKSETLIKFSLFFFVVKHLLTYLSSNISMLLFAQFTQIFAYALLIPSTVYYVNQHIDENDRIKGQSLVTTAMTLAGVFSSLAGGMLLDSIGIKSSLFIGVIISIIGFMIAFFSIKEHR